MLQTAVLLAAAAAQARAFTGGVASHARVASNTNTALHLQRQAVDRGASIGLPLAGRHFQLEELEDAEASTTDVLLNPDMTVTLGGTNGPLYVSSHGTWSESGQDDQTAEDFQRTFQMKLTRRFASGAEGQDGTEVGKFEYDVERTYEGEGFLVGGSVLAMNGEILDVDEIFGERRVGFFNMIDTTEEREENAMEL
ncbi:hypothetical protein ACHAXT_011315 [Thalassiosira profunda]